MDVIIIREGARFNINSLMKYLSIVKNAQMMPHLCAKNEIERLQEKGVHVSITNEVRINNLLQTTESKWN